MEDGGSNVLVAGKVEDRIEALSAAAGPDGREAFLEHWGEGSYCCARCQRLLYASSAKWRGPCPWPSFRRPESEDALVMRRVEGYNSYTCAVAEVFCGGCGLFLGHKFEDAREKGDTSPECTGWRH
mmetsp:Transcript_53858/g.121724  ORF Transcript_53858/g.121724 Transcript_53858/m.121724 type:complete len:126 (+) Transcript_53858:210-587(+)